MKVGKYCDKCKYKEDMRWKQDYKPAGYHRIGMTHTYAYCKQVQKPCRKVCMRDCFFTSKGVTDENT